MSNPEKSGFKLDKIVNYWDLAKALGYLVIDTLRYGQFKYDPPMAASDHYRTLPIELKPGQVYEMPKVHQCPDEDWPDGAA